MTPKLKRPPKSELINGVEQAPNGIIEKKGRVEGEGREGYERKERNERKERKNAVKAFCTGSFHSRSRQMTVRAWWAAYIIWRRP